PRMRVAAMRSADRELAAHWLRPASLREAALADSAFPDASEARRQPPQLPLPARPSADWARQRSASAARAFPPARLQPRPELLPCQRPEAPERSTRGSLHNVPGVQACLRARSPKAPARQKPSAGRHRDALLRLRPRSAKLPAGGHARFWGLQSSLSRQRFPSGNVFAPESCADRERKFNWRSRTSVSSASVDWAWLIPRARSPARMRFRSPVESRSRRRLTLDSCNPR